ncbi:MAG: DUF2079 domain-containing protein [Candidatus Omnitrophica bacterium]|nr:DUF2079 domain-containing protein [Candidatus Omnitrophota bacterium]
MNEKITRKQRKFIRRKYPDLSPEEMAQRLKIKPELVQQAITDLGLEVVSGKSFFGIIDRFFDRYAGAMTAIVTVGYVLLFSLISILRYRAFDYVDFDLAIYSQIVWNILHGSMQSTILGIPFLGSHLSLILFLVAPFCALFSTPLTLLLLQTLSIGLAVVPLYLLARNILDKSWALIFSILYLFYPALHFVNSYEFHPVVFTIVFLLFMLYYFEIKRFVPFMCFMFLSLLCKENISLAIFFFGLYVLFFRKRDWKWWVLPLASGALWFIVGLKIIPYFNKDIVTLSVIYSHLGGSMPEVIRNLVEHPVIVFKTYIVTEPNIKFLFQLLFPLAFLCLLSPKALLIAVPFLLQQLLSGRMTDHTIYYHYTAKLIPILFFSAIYGTRFILRSRFVSRHKWFLFAVLLSTSIISNIYFGFLPRVPASFSSSYAMEDMDYVKQNFIDRIPKEASAVATFEFLPKLSQREGIYSFHHVYMGKYSASKEAYTLPGDVEYALIDFNDRLTFTSFYQPDHYKNLQKFFAEDKWGLVAAADNIGLFKKGYKTDLSLFQDLEEFSPLSPAEFLVEDDIIIRGYKIEDKKIKPGHMCRLSLIWECSKKTDRDYWMAFKLVDKEGNVLHRYNHPICYRVYPTYSWKKGDVLKEDVWIFVPPGVKGKNVQLKMGIFWREIAGPGRGLAKGVSIKSNVSGIFDGEGWINLGKIKMDLSANDKGL